MPLIIPSNSISAGGYVVDNSLRFNDGSSDFLSKTFGSAGNQQKMTISFWIKRSDLSGTKEVISQGSGSACHMNFQSSGTLEMNLRNSVDGGSNVFLITNRLFRDVSAWYHIVLALDTTQGTASNRAKLYVNGVQETSFGTENYPSQNGNLFFNEASAMQIGEDTGGGNFNYDGYMAEFVFINAEQLDPTSFGEFDEDSGIWKPIDVSELTFGTNGFYLDFENSGSLGADVSGNGNNFTVNNLTAIDQTTDTPTNNFATWNPLSNYSSVTMSEGNMKAIVSASSPTPNCSGSIYPTTGKWYWEGKITESGSNHMFGIRPEGLNYNQGNYWNVSGTYSAVTYYADNGYVYINGASSAYGSTYASGDIIGVAMDLTNGFVYFSKNGTWQNSGDPTSGATGTGAKTIPTLGLPYTFALGSGSSSWSTGCEINTGNAPYTISSGNTDGNGYGNFEYAVPDSYLSLCSANLSEVLG